MTVYAVVLLITQEGLPFLAFFTPYDWFLMAGAGFFNLLNSLLKQKALQYDTASRITMYNYLQSVIQLLFVMLLFNYVFQMQELLGIGIVLLTNVILVWKVLKDGK